MYGGASRCKEGEAGDNKLWTGCNTGQLGDCRGLYAAGGALEMGASRTWVIPSIVGTVEDVVDDLKGSGRVGLIDFVQVRPEGNGESGRGY